MVWAKRIFLFLLVNFLVMAVISFLLYLFNIQPFLTKQGINPGALALFCLIWGMAGALISLRLSKFMAKWLMSVQIVEPDTNDPALRELLGTIYQLGKKAGLPVNPEVGIYQSPEINAFATGSSKRNSLVAVSTGLLQRMRKDELEGVLGHEITHIANGDMVTMTLLQGIVNAFVMFLARMVAFAISRGIVRSRNVESEDGVSPIMYQMTVFLLEMVFMVLGSLVIARFSRFREFRADAGGAILAGKDKMINALYALKLSQDFHDDLTEQPAIQAFMISGREGFLKLFASHPPLEDRIARLKGCD